VITSEREPSKKKQRNDTKKYAKRIKSDNFWQGELKKSPIMLSQYRKFEWLDGTIIISYFSGSNNIFADCRKERAQITISFAITKISVCRRGGK
jgi:hypothetical protein